MNIQSEEAWMRKEAGPTLNSLFVGIQERVQRFEENKISPSNDLEEDLIKRVITKSNDKSLFRKF